MNARAHRLQSGREDERNATDGPASAKNGDVSASVMRRQSLLTNSDKPLA